MTLSHIVILYSAKAGDNLVHYCFSQSDELETKHVVELFLMVDNFGDV